MKILDVYIGKILNQTIFAVLFVLLAIFAFFEFLDELDQLGKGRYGLGDAIEYTLLSMPRMTYEIFPIAALIGSLVGLSGLVNSSEITAIRIAGLSLRQVIIIVLKMALFSIAFATLLGEFVVPYTDQQAENMRSVATSDQITLKTRNGFWSRDKNNFINIRKILPGNRVEGIFIYAFDDAHHLLHSTHAKRASYQDGRWLLEDINLTRFTSNRVKRKHIDKAAWDSMLNPELVNLVAVKPNNLSVRDLNKYINYLTTNSQNSLQYSQALWFKSLYPLTTAVMIFLAIPIVLNAPRSVTLGQRILIGAAIGLLFHIFTKAVSHLGIVLNINPALSITVPTLLTFLAALLMLQRIN